MFFNHRIEGPKDVVIERGGAGAAAMERMPLPPGIVMQGATGAIIEHNEQTTQGLTAATTVNFKNENLGKRLVEGVEAEETRTTVTIPAGQIGNDRALDTVSERWYSNDRKTVRTPDLKEFAMAPTGRQG